jgi:hypothetical protein
MRNVVERFLIGAVLFSACGPEKQDGRLAQYCVDQEYDKCLLLEATPQVVLQDSRLFHGKWVRVPGYVILRFEGDAVYPSEDLLRQEDAIFLARPRPDGPINQCDVRGHGTAMGRYRHGSGGHLGGYGGLLEDATLLWPAADTVCY